MQTRRKPWGDLCPAESPGPQPWPGRGATFLLVCSSQSVSLGTKGSRSTTMELTDTCELCRGSGSSWAPWGGDTPVPRRPVDQRRPEWRGCWGKTVWPESSGQQRAHWKVKRSDTKPGPSKSYWGANTRRGKGAVAIPTRPCEPAHTHPPAHRHTLADSLTDTHTLTHPHSQAHTCRLTHTQLHPCPQVS